MDFQFTHHLGNVIAKCSMEHIAVANWFNTEVALNSQLISNALLYVEQAKTFAPEQENRLIGKEYSVFINADEVMVRANNLSVNDENEQQLQEQDFHYYDAESIAFLGLDDFERFLKSYLEFVR
ncbi:hypothetical protein A4G18_01660 [Pasteurellaceae bacterium Pebbles2]|nr:hypothetical protein [Pasteurellaceae bacterium Pebbles2]